MSPGLMILMTRSFASYGSLSLRIKYVLNSPQINQPICNQWDQISQSPVYI